MEMPRDGVERMISIRSAEGDHYTDSQAGLISPQDNNALSRMVNRTMEVDDKQWVALHKNSEHKAVSDKEKPEKPGKVSKVSKGSERKFVFWRKGLPVINPYSKVYGWWCAFVLFTDATYTAFVVPIGVGFNTSSAQWNWVGYFDFYAGVTFAVELIISWNVAFVATHNLRKRIVLKRSKIAEFYIWHSTFVFDSISTIVFIIQCIGYALGSAGTSGGSIIQVIQILRALRLLRLMKLLQQLFVMSLTAPQTHVPLINRTVPVWLSYLTQLAYIVGLFINFLACLWVFVAYREQKNDTWLNNYTPFVSGWSSDPTATSLTAAEVANIPGPDVYLAAAYWSLTAITTIGFGDILPITNAERAVMLLVEVLGVLFFGILLGSITSLLQRASQEVKEAQMFREKMGHVTEWMGRVQLPRDLKVKIRAYYAEVWVRQTVVENDMNLFMELPTHLKAQVAWRSNKPVLDKLNTFQDLSVETQYMIAGRAKPVKVAPGHEICAQGEPADCIWLLHEGDVVATYHYREAEVEKAPAIVGETALLAGSEGQYSVRPCGYRALTACVLWEITMQDLQPIVDWQEDVADMLEKRARENLLWRQSEHPHLWGLSSSDFESGGKYGKEFDDLYADGDDGDGIDMSEDEGADGSSADDKPGISSQSEADIDRPSNTLKPHSRTSKGFVDTLQKAKAGRDQDRGNGLLSKTAITAPDDNHIVLTMPTGNGTTPWLGADAEDLAEPHDSAYSADTSQQGHLQHPQGQSHAGAADSCPADQQQGHQQHHVQQQSQWQGQQLQQRQQVPQQQHQAVEHQGSPVLQADGAGSQHAQPGALNEDGKALQLAAGPGDQSCGDIAAAQLQQAEYQQPPQGAEASLTYMVSEPLGENAQGAAAKEPLSQREERQQQLQQQCQAQRAVQQQHRHLAHSYRSYAGWPTRHLQKRPSRHRPEGALPPAASSPPAFLAAHSGNMSLPPNQPGLQSGAQSSQYASGSAQSQADSAFAQSKVGESPAGGASTQEQQLDALHQQLQGLLEASSSINTALLQVKQQLQAFQPKK